MDVFDAGASEDGRDEGMGRVARANDWWLPIAVDAIAWAAFRSEFFTSDRVWWKLQHDGVPEPTDRRAIGPAFRRAVKAEICEPTDARHLSVRAVAHAGPKPIYHSLIFGRFSAL